jgi:hypothetical protein
MAQQTIPPQHPMRQSPVGQQVWTVWTMFLWFLGTIYDQFVNKFALGTNTVAAAATTLTVVHGLGFASYTVILTPNGAAPPGTYWVSGKTTTQFVINLSTPAPAGGTTFDWMVKAK